MPVRDEILKSQGASTRRIAGASLVSALGVASAIVSFFLVNMVVGIVVLGAFALSAVLLAFRARVWPIYATLGLLPGFRAESPQTIKEQYEELAGLIDRLYPLPTRVDKEREKRQASSKWQNVNTRLTGLAHALGRESDMHWGRSSARRQLRCAWLLVLSGHAYERGARISRDLDPDKHDDTSGDENEPPYVDNAAADQYHHGANAFRGAGTFRLSFEYYVRSARCCDVRTQAGSRLRRRSLFRALAVATMMGDLDAERDMRAELETLE